MRGLLPDDAVDSVIVGITPAHAGLTFCASSQPSPLRDHPRACGAYPRAGRFVSLPRGSPPRMRGLLFQRFKLLNTLGITPAHAGLTFW